MKIRKRNGAGEEYRREKIARVIQLAFESVGMNEAGTEVSRMSADIENKLLARGEELVPVESIQDLVEAELMLAGHYEAAKSFILYRNERSRARTAREQLLAQFEQRGELEQALREIIASVGASGPQDMGRVMGTATKQLAGKAEGRAISAKEKELLAQ